MIFYSLDVETANPDPSSICQIGVGVFEDGRLVDTWSSYIDPVDYFHWRFTQIHGITQKMVHRKPTFARTYPQLRKMFEHNLVVHHSPFDRVAFQKAFLRFGLEPFDVQWIDSVKIARRAWINLEGGYSLANLAYLLDIEFKHHDALEDSITAGKIVVHACKKCGIDLTDIRSLEKKPKQ